MNLEKHLVLSKYFLHLFGYAEFDKLREDFNQTPEGFDAAGNSFVLHGLMAKSILIAEHDLFRYDETIKGYEDKLRANRNETDFSIKYFQYFAILFSEYYSCSGLRDIHTLYFPAAYHTYCKTKMDQGCCHCCFRNPLFYFNNRFK